MGRASRTKQSRTRERSREWSATAAAREAHQLRREALDLLPGHPLIRRQLRDMSHDALMTAFRTAVLSGGMDEDSAKEYALATILGGVGYAPPWSRDDPDLEQYADWLMDRHRALLERAEVLVVSPGAHAAVMAAASTLEVAETATLDRETDVPMPVGLLVLPEPTVLTNRNGSTSDIKAYGWAQADLHNNYPAHHTGLPGIWITHFMDREGPVQPEGWRQMLALARSLGHPYPRLIPDGEEGMVANGALKGRSAEEIREVSQHVTEINTALRGHTLQQPSEVGEWTSGQVVEDSLGDFTRCYMFAFWRLAAQGSTAVTPAPAGPTAATAGRPATTALGAEPAVRIVRLNTKATTASGAGTATATRTYHHRWPVRMHKVNQWYPREGEHRIIWRGPYIKGPADAPLLLTDKAYRVD
ncbi:hypothetical protein ABUW04_00015 [Streptacidiphilus sp. N1-10]|uniref:Uncharacterized protein n=1 Tax=Streptacidiphilus jeojiensis TaxID=3229225 RepID=A0ABV6XEE3_9ACTN